MSGRRASARRETLETRVEVTLDLDGSGSADVRTGIGMLDHLLTSLARHARLDLVLRAEGDLEVCDHHTVEDTALTLGRALDEALGERLDLCRFGSAYAPLDESLARAVVDLIGRPWAEVHAAFDAPRLGALATENVAHFVRSLASAARLCVHLDLLRGANDHHRAEACVKALALALRAAWTRDPGAGSASTKGAVR